MTNQAPVIVQLTPAGRGAVATLLVEGMGASELVDKSFAGLRSIDELARDRLALGRFPDENGEQVVVRRRSEDSVELHCHGGLAAVAMVASALTKHGCRPVAWKDWLTAAGDEALAALPEARTARTSAILLDQYNGAMQRAVGEIESLLSRGERDRAKELVDVILARAELGKHLTRPWRVVLAGVPNSGKSSLINAILGYDRAIVHHAPGTTRDVVTAATAIDGWPVELSDTAGIRRGSTSTERAGIELTEQKLSNADLAILVIDASRQPSPEEQAVLETIPTGLIVLNKSDLPRHPERRNEGISTSATTGQGLDALLSLISTRLVPNPPPPGTAVPISDAQAAMIERLGQ